MSKPKQKFYVVWEGRDTGIFHSWAECNAHIEGFPQAKYKSFKTWELAEKAWRSPPGEFIGKEVFETTLTPDQLTLIGEPELESISVDGAWNTSSGDVEYRAVHTRTGELLFAKGPYEDGTNNIAEFLGLVHAMAHCVKHGLGLPIYTDSMTAISWVRRKKSFTKHPRSERKKTLFDMVNRAEHWLATNEYTGRIRKWETEAWGEIKADFGRK